MAINNTGKMDHQKFQLWEELEELGLDDSTRSSSEVLYFKIKSNEEENSKEKALVLMRCCSLVFSLTQPMKTVEGLETLGGHVNVSHFLKNSSKDLNVYLTHLEKIQAVLSQSHFFSLQELIRKVEISKILFIKFKETWEKVQLKGNNTFVSSMMQMLWLVLINLKFYYKIHEIAEIGYLIISTFDVFLRNVDEKTVALEQPFMNELCSFFKANPEIASTWVRKIEKGVQEYIATGDMFSKDFQISGVFKGSVLNRNVNLLNALYQSQMDNSNIDERDLILLKQKIRTPQKPRFLRQNKPNGTIGKVLKWDENFVGPSINSKLHEASQTQASPYIPPPTPMSMAMELDSWFSDFFDCKREDEDLKNVLSPHVLSVLMTRTENFMSETKTVFDQREIGTNSAQGLKFVSENFEGKAFDDSCVLNTRLEQLKVFFFVVIGKILKKEHEKENCVEKLALNEEFVRGIFACCLETLLFTKNILKINFEEVLSISGTNCFEFWKAINPFFQFDSNIPHSVRRHFREIEVKILSCLAWKEGSRVNSYIKEMKFSNHDQNESSDTSLFLKRLLSHCANRILELTNALSLNESLKEEIWSTFKYVLSEKTEILINRHADYLILCTIFGVCKVNNPVEFRVIIEKYRLLYMEDTNFFKKVQIQAGLFDTIIVFYNQIFIQATKEFITHQIKQFKPRLEVLNPPSPLRASIPIQMTSYVAIQNLIKSPLKSIVKTPRSEALWATNEAFSPLRKPNEIQAINFDRPISFKRPKIIEDILNTKDEGIGPAPVLKKEKTVEDVAICLTGSFRTKEQEKKSDCL
jgi:hypothetical protein